MEAGINIPELVRIAEEVEKTRKPRKLMRDNEPVALITPVRPTREAQKRTAKTKADYEAFRDGLAISIVTFAEIYEGIYYGQKRSLYEHGLHQFLQGVRLLGITRSIARQFAILRGQLRATSRGKALVQPKDNYDLFIAATAIRHKLTLITRNIQDYDRIPHLKLYQGYRPESSVNM